MFLEKTLQNYRKVQEAFFFGRGLGKFLPKIYFDAVCLHCNNNGGRSLGFLLECFV